jgi:hypothetical protein
MDCLLNGDLDKVKEMVLKNSTDFLHSNFENIFRWACRSENIEVPKWLWKYSNDIGSPIDICARYKNNDAFRVACCYGNLETAKWLWELSLKLNKPIDINLGDDVAFRLSCEHNHLHIAKWLWDLSFDDKINKDNLPIDFSYRNHIVFRKCCSLGLIDIVLWLCEIYPNYEKEIHKYDKIVKRILFEKINKHKNNLEELRKITWNMGFIEENNDELECLVCKESKQYMINLKCQKKYDHSFCIECFYQWYKNNETKCVMCSVPFYQSEKQESQQQIQHPQNNNNRRRQREE